MLTASTMFVSEIRVLAVARAFETSCQEAVHDVHRRKLASTVVAGTVLANDVSAVWTYLVGLSIMTTESEAAAGAMRCGGFAERLTGRFVSLPVWVFFFQDTI
jgi:hypothetical protein